MELLAAFRIFADHYTFAVHDSEAEPCPESFLELVPSSQPGVLGSFDVGYITDGQSILLGTCADLNDHWLELFRSDAIPDFGSAQRVIALPLEVSSGVVIVSTMIVDGSIELTPGCYTVYLLGFSLGWDQSSEPPWPAEIVKFTDDEYAARKDFEHYQIVFVPGNVIGSSRGVVHGAPDIESAREAA